MLRRFERRKLQSWGMTKLTSTFPRAACRGYAWKLRAGDASRLQRRSEGEGERGVAAAAAPNTTHTETHREGGEGCRWDAFEQRKVF